jgi:hypothetical protein
MWYFMLGNLDFPFSFAFYCVWDQYLAVFFFFFFFFLIYKYSDLDGLTLHSDNGTPHLVRPLIQSPILSPRPAL